MKNVFERQVSNSGPLLLDRLLKQNKNSSSLFQLQNQQNIPIKQNKNDNEIIASKINKTESVDFVIKNENQAYPQKKIDPPIVQNKEKMQIQKSPEKKGLSVFDPNYKDEIKKQDKIPKGRLLTLKIVGKQNKCLGQLQLDQNYLKNKGSEPPNWKEVKVQINKQYKNECQQAWSKIRHYKQTLNLGLNSTNVSILSNIARAPHQPMGENIIRRLTDGFHFYEFSQQRDEAIRELVKQYTSAGINAGLCEQVRRICQKGWQGSKVDGALAFYYCLNGGRDDDCSRFLMEDMVNLVRIYQQLMKQGRLSSRKLIKTSSQTTILDTLPKYYSKYLNTASATDLGKQILVLLNIIVIKHKAQINRDELIRVFIPLVKQLQNIMSSNLELRKFLDSFMIELFINWQRQLQGVQIGGIVEQCVIGYYRRYHAQDMTQLHAFMVKLAQFTEYGTSMQTMVAAKCQEFIGKNRKNMDHSKQALLHTAMQAILLIKESIKANIKEPELIQILYQCCPVSIFIYLQNTTHHMEMILPLICKYYKNLSNKSSQLTITELNNALPASYVLPNCENYLIIRYLADLLGKYAGQQIVSSCYQKLDDVEETLLKFNASSIVTQSSQYVPMEIVKLLCKYVVNFGTNYDASQPHVGYQVVQLLFSAMQALITHFYSQNKGTDQASLARVVCNVEMLSCIIISTGILTINRQKDSVQRKQKQSQNNTRIWETYSKISQLLLKICQQWTSSKSHMKIVYRSCIKIYEQYWNEIKQSCRWLKCRIYLQSAITALQIQCDPKQKYEMVVLLDRRYKSYNITHVLQQIVVNQDPIQTLYQVDWQDIARMVLILLAYVLKNHQGQPEVGYQVRTWQTSISKVVMQNAQKLVGVCLYRMYEDKSTPENTIQYCRVISYILQHCHNPEQSYCPRKDFKKICLLSLINKPTNTPFASSPPTVHQFISKIYLPGSSVKLHILFSLMAANFNEELFGNIVELGYLPTVLAATMGLMGKLMESNDDNMWLITCLDMFRSLYVRRYVEVDADNGATVAQALLIVVMKQQHHVNPIKISEYMQIVLPLISNSTTTTSYHKLLRAFITYTAKHPNIYDNQRQQATSINKQTLIQHFIIIIQVLMVSLANDSITATIFEGIAQEHTESALEEMTRLLAMLYDGLHEVGCIGDKRVRTLVIITLKISQYINTYQTISTNNIAQTASLLRTAIKKSQKTIMSWVDQTLSANLQQLLCSSLELLQSGSQNKSYNHYNQALVNLSMQNRVSFTNYVVGLGAHIVGSLQKMRRSSTKPGIDSYRCYYLFYYFLQKVLEDQTGKYVNHLYQTEPKDYLTTQVSLQQPIKDTLINIINQLSHITNCKTIEIWHITLISTILKLQPKLIHTGTIFSKVVQFCCKLMEILQSMGQETNYLQGWLCFAQVADFVCFIYQTHSYYGHMAQEDLCFLRKTIFHRIQQWMLKWDNIRTIEEQKFVYFPLWPIFSSPGLKDKVSKPMEMINKTNLGKYELSTIKTGQKDKKSSEDDGSDEKKHKKNIFYYLKHVMMLYSLCKILDLYRLDIEAPSTYGLAFKSKLIQFIQKILNDFSKYYDQYFAPAQIMSTNMEILTKGILHYAKDPEITNSLCYLNKILYSYTYDSEHNSSCRKIIKCELNPSLVSSSAKQLNAITWYNSIEQILASMGQKASSKFMTAKINSMGSRRMSASRKTSTSRRVIF